MSEITITPGEQRIPSGEGALIMPPEFLQAAGMFGQEALMRRMMRDPYLGLAYQVICALVLEGEHQILPAIGDPDEDDADPEALALKALADEYAVFVEGFVKRLRRPLRRSLLYAMEALPYGHKLSEIEHGLDDEGRIVVVDVAPKPRGAYELRLDKANRLVAVVPRGAGVKEGDVLNPSSVFIFSLGGRDDSPVGTPALERAYEAWYRKGCAKPNETKALAIFAGGVVWAEGEKDVASTVNVVDATGKTTTQNATQLIANEVAKLRTGRTAALPPGWTLESFPPAQNFGAFDSTYNRCDREMVTSFFVASRSLMEAEFGSKADSETAEGMVASIRDWLRGELCEAVRSQIFMPVIVANFGEPARDLCPIYDITTEERSEIAAVSQILAAFDNAGMLVPELADYLLTLIGVPENVRRAVVKAIQGMETEAEEMPQTEQEEEERSEQFESRFAEVVARRGAAWRFAEDKVTRASKAKSAVADRRARRIISRYDKSLRKTVSRWLDGRIDDEAFELRFGELLANGHEEAARLGSALAGRTGAALPAAVREYVASTLSIEGDHLRTLVEEVEQGLRTPAQTRLAARRYAGRMSGTMSAAFHEASPEEATFTWQLGAAEHCEDCPRLASMSPWQKDELFTRPREGDTMCRLNCKCRLVRDDGAVAPGFVGLDDYDE